MAQQKGTTSFKAALWTALILGFVWMLYSYEKNSNQPIEQEALQEATAISIDEKLKSAMYYTITGPSEFPRTYKKFGAAWVKHTNDMLPKAAAYVAQKPECESVADVLASDDDSTKEMPSYTVYCMQQGERTRYEITDADINEGSGPVSQKEKTESLDVKGICIERVRQEAGPFVKINTGLFVDAVYDENGGALVEVPFTAKDAYGAEAKMISRCWMDAKGHINSFKTLPH